MGETVWKLSERIAVGGWRSVVGGRELSEAGLAGFIGFSGLGVKSRESEFPPTDFY